MKKLTLAFCLLLSGTVSASDAPAEAAKLQGDAEAGKTKALVCGACHGADGNSPTPAPGAPESAVFPKLAGQHVSYLVEQLQAFKSGKRQNMIMASQVVSLSEQDMLDLATYYGSQNITPGAASEELAVAGSKMYLGGNKATKAPACMACHGPAGEGNPAAKYPALAGQHAAYILTQLNRYKAGNHAGTANGKMMQDVAARLSEEEAQAVASYIAGLH